MSGRTGSRRITSYSRSTTRTYGASKPLEDFPGFHQKEADSGQSGRSVPNQMTVRTSNSGRISSAIGSLIDTVEKVNPNFK